MDNPIDHNLKKLNKYTTLAQSNPTKYIYTFKANYYKRIIDLQNQKGGNTQTNIQTNTQTNTQTNGKSNSQILNEYYNNMSLQQTVTQGHNFLTPPNKSISTNEIPADVVSPVIPMEPIQPIQPIQPIRPIQPIQTPIQTNPQLPTPIPLNTIASAILLQNATAQEQSQSQSQIQEQVQDVQNDIVGGSNGDFEALKTNIKESLEMYRNLSTPHNDIISSIETSLNQNGGFDKIKADLEKLTAMMLPQGIDMQEIQSNFNKIEQNKLLLTNYLKK